MKDDVWLKTHVESIAVKTTVIEKQNIQEIVSQTVHSSTTQRIIDGYSKTICLRHAAATTNDFADIICEEGETEKEKENRITEVVQNHQFAKAAKMAAEETTEEKGTELDAETVKEKAKLQEQHNYLIVKSLNKFEQKDIANIPKTEALSKTQAINIYTKIQDDCNQCNRYALLQSLMRRLCQFMKPEPEGWGPKWPWNATPEKYVVKLQAYCSVTNVKCEKVDSRIQQSKEMLHQAALLYNQAVVIKLDNDLSIWKSIHMKEVLSEEWRIEGLVGKFADYKHISVI